MTTEAWKSIPSIFLAPIFSALIYYTLVLYTCMIHFSRLCLSATAVVVATCGSQTLSVNSRQPTAFQPIKLNGNSVWKLVFSLMPKGTASQISKEIIQLSLTDKLQGIEYYIGTFTSKTFFEKRGIGCFLGLDRILVI